MDKKAAAAALGVSVRRVEEFASAGRLGTVNYVRGKTGKKADFDAEAVGRLKHELESTDAPADGQRAALVPASQIAALQRLGEMFAQAARPADTRPVLMTRAEAIEASGLPRTWLALAVKCKAVEQIGKGRAARLRRDEVLALAARPDLAKIVGQWREQARPEQTRRGAARASRG